MTAFTDTEGRATLADYVTVPQVYPAGRLDYESEGLLILTSNGKLAHRITHPRHKLPKTYLAQVERIPDETALQQLRAGVLVKGRRTAPAQVTLLSIEPNLFARTKPIRDRKTVPTAWLKLTITEGKKRQVRRMTAAIGYPTLRLVRIAIGPIQLENLQPGQWRELTAKEVRRLWQSNKVW